MSPIEELSALDRDVGIVNDALAKYVTVYRIRRNQGLMYAYDLTHPEPPADVKQFYQTYLNLVQALMADEQFHLFARVHAVAPLLPPEESLKYAVLHYRSTLAGQITEQNPVVMNELFELRQKAEQKLPEYKARIDTLARNIDATVKMLRKMRVL
ncbi:hypothetical protein HY490_00375 [Candidatus Woesearchaeota archaeon]|nr:hypothetical protein [Candidatus Woesearchaeota archaeon]